MRAVISAVSEALSRRVYVGLLLALWLAIVLTSPWWLTPGGDDGFYLYQVLSFLRDGTFAVPFFDDWHRVYSNLPGYPAAQGVFFWAWTHVGLAIDVYTHRAFQIVCVAGIILLGAALAARAGREAVGASAASGRLAAAVFLGVLGVTPFPVDALFQRPEAFGILSTMAALALFAGALRNADARLGAAAGLALAMSMTTHPTFVIAGAVIGLAFAGALSVHRRWRVLAAGVVGAAVPLTLMLLYFARGGASALRELLGHVAMRQPRPGAGFASLRDEIVAAAVHPSATTAYLAIPYFVLALLLTVILVLLALRATAALRARKWPFGPIEGGIHAFFTGTLVNIALDSSGRVQIFSPMGCSAALSIAALLAAASTQLVRRSSATGTVQRRRESAR